jgi:hypothetical protein
MIGMIQIAFVPLLYGILNRLTFSWVVGSHLTLSLILVGWVMVGRRARLGPGLRDFFSTLKIWLRKVFGWENYLLLILGFFVWVWVLIAAIFLPPRGIDDLVYHLPSLYHFVQNQGIELLPLDLRRGFAMPLNGDLLFLWPLLFFGNDYLIDMVVFWVVLYGVGVLYSLGRQLDIAPRHSFFVAQLFIFLPVVLGQIGSNYNDVITAVCFLSLLNAVFNFYRTGEKHHLIIAGIITGYGLGVKYSMFIFSLAVQPILWLRFWEEKSFKRALVRYSTYILLTIPISLYWYVRNYLETGHPFYPRIFGGGDQTGMVSGMVQGVAPKLKTDFALGAFLEDPINFLMYPFFDLGLGSLHGGFGVIFWGLGFPCVAYFLFQGVRKAFRKDCFPLFFWGQILVGFYSVFLTINKDFEFNQRYVLFVVGFGLLAVGNLFQNLRGNLPFTVPILKLFCVGSSFLAVMHLASYGWPSYQIKPAVEDWLANQQTSEYKYYRQSPWDLPSLSMAWEPLDYLTREGDGWNVYMAATHGVFWVTPTYGSHLQNKIWNFEENPQQDPDAYIFHYDSRSMELFYLGKKITPAEVLNDKRYELVTQTPFTTFWVKRQLLDHPSMAARLADYYEKTFPPAIQTATALKHLVMDDGVIVTSSPLGYGFKYLFLTGKIRSPVYLVPRNQEEEFVKRADFQTVYTVGNPLGGFHPRDIAELMGPQGRIYFYENIKK